MQREIASNHPGEHLAEFMQEYGLTAYRLARAIHVPRSRIEAIVRDRRAVTADTAIRLGRLFGTTPEFWMNLQARHDLVTAGAAIGQGAEAIVPVAA